MSPRADSVERALLTQPALAVAPLLLGATLVSERDGQRVVVRLSEVEAYEGHDDPASHAFRGPTPRNQVMFGPPGRLYTYFTYGMHWCANVVCDEPGRAAAVLLRSGEVIDGLPVASARRPAARTARELAAGPARLAATLGLGREQNGLDLLDPASPVRLADVRPVQAAEVSSGPRVGIRQAADRAWRFWLTGDPTVSAFRAGGRDGSRGRTAD